MRIKGKYVCDCEVGSIKTGWRTCNRPAICRSTKRFWNKDLGESVLDYCGAHMHKAGLNESPEVFQTPHIEYIGDSEGFLDSKEFEDEASRAYHEARKGSFVKTKRIGEL